MLVPDVLWFAGEIALDAPRASRLPELAVEVRPPTSRVYDLRPASVARGRARELRSASQPFDQLARAR